MPVWIVKIKPVPERRPFFQNPYQYAPRNMRKRNFFRNIGESMAGNRGVKHVKDIIKSNLTINTDPEYLPVLFKFP